MRQAGDRDGHPGLLCAQEQAQKEFFDTLGVALAPKHHMSEFIYLFRLADQT